MAVTGYSFASLAKKLSLKEGMRVWFDTMPDSVRAVILPATPLVDVKVCAVDAVWSGVKLMIRKGAR